MATHSHRGSLLNGNSLSPNVSDWRCHDDDHRKKASRGPHVCTQMQSQHAPTSALTHIIT